MKTMLGRNYYEIGDKINQDAYSGCPAEIVEIVDEQFNSGRTVLYNIQIDATGHPEAFDANGEPESIKYTLMTTERLDYFNQ